MDILSVRNQIKREGINFKDLRHGTLSKYLTKFSSNKKRKSPYNTIAATNCEGDPPLEID